MELLGRTVGRLNEKFLITRIKAIKVYYAKSSTVIFLFYFSFFLSLPFTCPKNKRAWQKLINSTFGGLSNYHYK